MFKSCLMALGGLFLFLIVGFIGLLIWAQRSGSQEQERFFKAVVSGDPQEVMSLCSPELKDEIDAPVLGAWINEVRKQLGAYRNLSSTDFDTSVSTTEAGTIIKSKGTVHFEHGDAKSDLTFRNGLLTAFSIESDKITGDWFQGPTESELYRERGEQFIRAFFAKDGAKCTAMMHEGLRKEVPEEKLKSFMETIIDSSGPLTSVTFLEKKFTTDEGQQLQIDYLVEGEKSNVIATIKFRFVGLKGHLLGFNFKSQDKEKVKDKEE